MSGSPATSNRGASKSWASFRAPRPGRSRSIFWLGAALTLACSSGPPLEPPRLDPDLIQRGAFLFLDTAVSGDGSTSCATCHAAGAREGALYVNGKRTEPSDPNGLRAPALRGLWQTAPYLWDGSASSVSDAITRMLSIEMRGSALTGREREALDAYVLSIPPFDNGRIQPDGSPTEPATLSARRGFEVYKRAECSKCHPPPSYAHRFRFDIGTGGKWSVPTLRGISAGGPFGHDGRWPDIETALTAILEAREVELTNPEFHQLRTYLELL